HPLSLHDALPIYPAAAQQGQPVGDRQGAEDRPGQPAPADPPPGTGRSFTGRPKQKLNRITEPFSRRFDRTLMLSKSQACRDNDNKPLNTGKDRKSTRLNSSHV